MLIIVMAPDPKPRHGIPFQNPDRPIAPGYSDCPDMFFVIDALKAQRGMEGILCPQTIGFSRALFELRRQRRVCNPKRREGGGVHNWS